MNGNPTCCPYCETLLEPIRLLAPPTPDVFSHGVQPTDLTFVAPGAQPGLDQARSAIVGTVRGMICRKCWRLSQEPEIQGVV